MIDATMPKEPRATKVVLLLCASCRDLDVFEWHWDWESHLSDIFAHSNDPRDAMLASHDATASQDTARTNRTKDFRIQTQGKCMLVRSSVVLSLVRGFSEVCDMPKKILITGATDGIGLETARLLASQGHHVLVHGRNPAKLAEVASSLGGVPSYVCDLSLLKEVAALADKVAADHDSIDVLINNAGIFQTTHPVNDALDVRFSVNTIAPYILTRRLMPLIKGRVVNLSSAAQAPVDLDALVGRKVGLPGMQAYSQSKLAITMWTRYLAHEGPVVVAVNPGSMLGSKMVKEAFGVAGGDLRVGANILAKAALSDDFKHASGKYFDNDARRFGSPHPDAMNDAKIQALVDAMDALVAAKLA